MILLGTDTHFAVCDSCGTQMRDDDEELMTKPSYKELRQFINEDTDWTATHSRVVCDTCMAANKDKGVCQWCAGELTLGWISRYEDCMNCENCGWQDEVWS